MAWPTTKGGQLMCTVPTRAASAEGHGDGGGHEGALLPGAVRGGAVDSVIWCDVVAAARRAFEYLGARAGGCGRLVSRGRWRGWLDWWYCVGGRRGGRCALAEVQEVPLSAAHACGMPTAHDYHLGRHAGVRCHTHMRARARVQVRLPLLQGVVGRGTTCVSVSVCGAVADPAAWLQAPLGTRLLVKRTLPPTDQLPAVLAARRHTTNSAPPEATRSRYYGLAGTDLLGCMHCLGLSAPLADCLS